MSTAPNGTQATPPEGRERWEWRELGDLGTWVGGGTPSKQRPDFWEGGTIPWVSPKDMKSWRLNGTRDAITETAAEESSTKRFVAGSVALVVRSGILEHTLPVSLVPFSATANQDMRVVTPNEHVTAEWLLYALRAESESIRRACRKDGTTVASIDVPKLTKWTLHVPTIEEQRRIVDRIERLRDHISAGDEVVKQVQKKAVALRRSTLSAAVEGRLGSMAVYERSSYHLLARIAGEMERLEPQRGPKKTRGAKESVPQIDFKLPRGWSVASWGEIGLSQNGRAFPSAAYSQEGIKLLRPGNLHASGEVRWEDGNTKRLPTRYEADHPGFIVRGRELVINLTAQSLKDDFLGRVCMTGPGETCLLNQRIARLTPVIMSPEYVLCVFRSPLFRRYVAGLNKGSLIQHIFTSEIDKFVLPIPPLEEQQLIVSALQRYESAFSALEALADVGRARSQDLWRAFLHVALRDPARA